MSKRLLTAGEEASILGRAEAYVNAQLATMASYGSAPTLTEVEFSALVVECARPALRIARLRKKVGGTVDG